MAFYTDYEEEVPFDTSVVITKSAICNAVAAMFVAHTGCTLVKYATLGVASSATNYAEITYAGMYIRFYSTSTSNMGSVDTYIATSSGGSSLTNSQYSFMWIQYISTTVKLRFYNTPSGFLTRNFTNSGIWSSCMAGVALTKIADGTSANAISLAIPTPADTTYCNDGLAPNGVYYIAAAADIGLYDTDGIKQVLNQEWLSPTSAAASNKRYKMNNCYISNAYQEIGIVEVDSRYFYIGSNTAVALEINS